MIEHHFQAKDDSTGAAVLDESGRIVFSNLATRLPTVAEFLHETLPLLPLKKLFSQNFEEAGSCQKNTRQPRTEMILATSHCEVKVCIERRINFNETRFVATVAVQDKAISSQIDNRLMIAKIRHELATPVSSIAGLCRRLARAVSRGSATPDELSGYVRDLSAIKASVQNVVDVHAPRRARVERKFESFDISELLTEIAEKN